MTKKTSLLLLTPIAAIVLLLSFTLLYQTRVFLTRCLSTTNIETGISCLQKLSRFQPELSFVANLSDRADLKLYNSILHSATRLLEHHQVLLGLQTSEPTTYMILFQNNYELRANGGFVGSYAVISVKDGQPEYRFQDIYVPDGQIPGHVDPPLPIQEAFKQGFWKLRDADWYPDFPTSAQNIRWFMREGREVDPDFLITLSFSTVDEILKILGPIEVPEFQSKLSPQNFYQVLQAQVETNFFAGSTQKKDTLASAGKSLIHKLQSATPQQKKQIALLLFKDLKNRNILLDAKDPKIQNLFEDLGFNGSLHYLPCTDDCVADHLSIINTNLGANKANCCTQSSTVHRIDKLGNQLKHQIDIQFTNTSRIENPSPPDFFGGNYINYIRFYLPPTASFIEIDASPTLPTHTPLYPVPYQPKNHSTLIQTTRFGFKEIGFFHTTRAGSTSRLRLSYSLPADKDHLKLTIQKQNGVKDSPTSIMVFGKNQTTPLETSFDHLYKIPD